MLTQAGATHSKVMTCDLVFVVADDPGDRVRGEVYRLHRPIQTLRKLDAYEGPEYTRGIRTVYPTGAATSARAWVYLYNQPIDRLRRIRSGDFLPA